MNSLHEALKWPFFLLTLFIMGTGSGGCGSQSTSSGAPPPVATSPAPTPTPPALDPLVVAQTTFKSKLWPFFESDRCANCHDFAARHKTYIFSGHPAPTGSPATCTGCHSQAVVGFPNWVEAPADSTFSDSDDPNKVRAQIIKVKGPLLFKHLIGEGVDGDPFVQWAFFNAPNAVPGSPAPNVNPGKVPPGLLPHNGQIPNAELMDWIKFKAAVQEWLCMEAKIPGAPDLGKPASLDCSVF